MMDKLLDALAYFIAGCLVCGLGIMWARGDSGAGAVLAGLAAIFVIWRLFIRRLE
jgi:hypothetical protein